MDNFLFQFVQTDPKWVVTFHLFLRSTQTIFYKDDTLVIGLISEKTSESIPQLFLN